MNYCETCKYWDYNYKNQFEPNKGDCTNEKLCEPSDEESVYDDALVYSYSEGGDFCTGPKFGCVHHEEKQK